MYLNFHTEHQISIIFTYNNRPNLRKQTQLFSALERGSELAWIHCMLWHAL